MTCDGIFHLSTASWKTRAGNRGALRGRPRCRPHYEHRPAERRRRGAGLHQHHRRTKSRASISQAKADADQKLKMAEQAVQIAVNRAEAEAAPHPRTRQDSRGHARRRRKGRARQLLCATRASRSARKPPQTVLKTTLKPSLSANLPHLPSRSVSSARSLGSCLLIRSRPVVLQLLAGAAPAHRHRVHVLRQSRRPGR